MSAEEFRAYAQECLRWSEETSDQGERETLLGLAKQWMQAALEAENLIALGHGATPLAPEGGSPSRRRNPAGRD